MLYTDGDQGTGFDYENNFFFDEDNLFKTLIIVHIYVHIQKFIYIYIYICCSRDRI
jgi:hypothetical protein